MSLRTKNAPPLPQPYVYCDSRCQRCPAFVRCALGPLLLARRERRLAMGLDADDAELIADDRRDALERSLIAASQQRVEQAGAPHGDDTHSASATRLLLLTQDLMHAVRAAAISAPPDQWHRRLPTLEALLLLYKKITGIEISSQNDDPRLFLGDTAPNLMLVERLDHIIARHVAVMAIETAWFRFVAARRRLWSVLSPLMQVIPRQCRDALDQLVLSRTAPSPFCVLDHERRQEQSLPC